MALGLGLLLASSCHLRAAFYAAQLPHSLLRLTGTSRLGCHTLGQLSSVSSVSVSPDAR